MKQFLEDLSAEELDRFTKKELSHRLTELDVEHSLNQLKSDLIHLLRAEGGQFDEEIVEHTEVKIKSHIEPKIYEVLYDFKDLEDGSYVYFKGDTYPRRANRRVPQDRIDELLSSDNKRKKQLIKERD